MEEAATSSSVASSSVGAQVSEEDIGCVRVLKLIKECCVTVKRCKQLHLRLVMLGFRQMTGIFSMRRFFFLSDDSKVHYYIGLTKCALLLSTFEFVMKPFCNGEKWAFYWHSFLIVLLKLRLNLGLQDLAYRLNVSLATVSRSFHATLYGCYDGTFAVAYKMARE